MKKKNIKDKDMKEELLLPKNLSCIQINMTFVVKMKRRGSKVPSINSSYICSLINVSSI